MMQIAVSFGVLAVVLLGSIRVNAQVEAACSDPHCLCSRTLEAIGWTREPGAASVAYRRR
jgi:hypothetical protein